MIRKFREDDLIQLQRIHEKYYKTEFSLEDFCSAFMDFFVITDNDKIVTAGGVRSIAESVLMTNKDLSVSVRRKALMDMLQAQLFTCGRLGYSQLHAFLQDPEWEKHLMKVGFKPCKGHALYIEVK